MPETEDGREIVVLPYLEEYPDGPRRPYLWLELQGPTATTAAFGLIVTGAVISVLPLGYASLLGFGRADLERCEIHGVGGQVDLYQTREPFSAWVEGLEEIVIPMQPAFRAGGDALWGRSDFLSVFGVIVEESRQEVSLILPRPT